MSDRQSVPSNIYTVLTIVAMLALLAGVVYLVMQSDKLFGSPLPMNAKPLSQALHTAFASLLS